MATQSNNMYNEVHTHLNSKQLIDDHLDIIIRNEKLMTLNNDLSSMPTKEMIAKSICS